MSKFKRVLKIILGILVISAFLVGIPIVINECYKTNCGYSIAWDASAMLGYYGTILGAIITVVTLVATITFTKKQIQRESFLKNESEKWSKLKSIFLDILSNINPIVDYADYVLAFWDGKSAGTLSVIRYCERSENNAKLFSLNKKYRLAMLHKKSSQRDFVSLGHSPKF